MTEVVPVRVAVEAGWHPAVDEFDERYVVFATSSTTVRFTEPFAAFVAEAAGRGVIPVLVTTIAARVSPFVSLAMRRSCGLWALQARDGTLYDALSGVQVDGLGDLCEPRGAVPGWTESGPGRPEGADGSGRLPGFFDPPAASPPVMTFDVRTRQRAVESSRVGAVAQNLGESLGVSWRCWATREPLLAAWDLGAVTAEVRRSMPRSPMVRVVGDGGAFCEVQVARTSAGLAEQTIGGVPVDGGADLLAVATDAAERLVAEHNPTMAFWSVADYDVAGGTVVHAPRARAPEAPLVVVVGPAAVRDLDVDADRLVAEHGARRLGRARMPCLLVRFDEPDPGRRWAQVAGFAVALGLGDELQTMGVNVDAR